MAVPKGSVLPCLIDVCHSSKQRTQDDLRVIFEEVYLQCAIRQMHDYGSTRSKPCFQRRNPGQLILFTNLTCTK